MTNHVASFVSDVHFGATFNGQTLGLTSNSHDRLTLLTRNTIGCANSHALVNDVHIGVIMYDPGVPSAAALAIEPNLDSNDLEYLIVRGPGTLLEGWRIRGISFEFPEFSTTTPATWIVSFDPDDPANANKLAAFKEHYGFSDVSPIIIGGYSGSLSNTGEQLRLERPDTPPVDNPTITPYVTVDEVIYDNLAPWPATANATGDSIIRRAPVFSGNDGSLWASSSTFDPADNVLGDFNGDELVDAADIDLLFDAVRRGSQVGYYVLSGTIPAPDDSEIQYFVEQHMGAFFGDANVDGAVDAIDFNIWNDHTFQSCTGWAAADFNGDGVDECPLNAV